MRERINDKLNLSGTAAAIVKEIEQGNKTQNQIAKQYGVSRQHVSYLKKRYVSAKPCVKKKTIVSEMIGNTQLTEREIADRCGCSVVYVKRIKRGMNYGG